jgi:serine O-acetyltransferase
MINIQIPIGTKISEGFYLGHFGHLIISPKTINGSNENIASGIVIG